MSSEQTGVRRLMAVCLLSAVCILLLPVSSWAHGFAGKRFFPTTFAVEDPFVSDEFSLLFNHRKEDSEVKTTSLAVELSKRITPNLGISIGEEYQHISIRGNGSESGFGNLELGLKYQFLSNSFFFLFFFFFFFFFLCTWLWLLPSTRSVGLAPTYRSPFTENNRLPRPAFMSFLNSPIYLSPFWYVSVPVPCFVSFREFALVRVAVAVPVNAPPVHETVPELTLVAVAVRERHNLDFPLGRRRRRRGHFLREWRGQRPGRLVERGRKGRGLAGAAGAAGAGAGAPGDGTLS